MILVLLAFVLQIGNDLTADLDTPSPIENWQVVSAFLLPLLMAVIIQTGWSRGLQATATMVVALVWTLIYQLLGDHSIIIPEVVIRGLQVFALAIPFYYGIWKPSGVAPKIEAATSK